MVLATQLCHVAVSTSFMMQEKRRHARLVKKASKLGVGELLEIVAMKGISTDKIESEVQGGTATADGNDATSGPLSSSSSSSGTSTSNQAIAPELPNTAITADVDVALSRDAKNNPLPEDEL